jgi:hypothetical protein
VLQPTDERRRSGSHYTPRSFTEPIVRKTLEPILNALARHPEPAQSLNSRSATSPWAAPRSLWRPAATWTTALVKAWRHHGGRPPLPDDETEELLAMRTVAQRCLYGVDRNPMAVDLAKLSLWLATLAKDHPFTFVDHAIRCGDSLVGLTARQIEDFTWHLRTRSAISFCGGSPQTHSRRLARTQSLLAAGDDFTARRSSSAKRLEKADELSTLCASSAMPPWPRSLRRNKDKAREAKRMELAERLPIILAKANSNQRPTDEK